MAAANHPAADQLAAFGLGKLEPAAMAAVEEHIARCEACCSTLRDVLDDTMISLARAAALGHDEAEATADPPALTVELGPPQLSDGLKDHPRYRILGRLGAGGMGVVYKAEHRLMERTVALKVMARRFTANALALGRFQREVKAAARLQHPNIVAAFDADQAGELHFLVMEYVAGISLAGLVKKQGPLPVHQACRFVVQAAQGLQHAHEQGMVHRDIKPHNLMVTKSGQIKVLDFGLARLADDVESDGRITAVDAVVGTPDYLAPEQARNARNVDIRGDIYSLGCTLYYLLAGRPPFPEGTAVEKLLAHCEQDPMPIDELRPEVPAPLAAVVRRMMAREPEDRYQTPAEVATVLAPFMRAQPAPPPPGRARSAANAAGPSGPPARPDRPLRQAKRGAFRHGPVAAAIVLGSVILVALAAWHLIPRGDGSATSAPGVTQAKGLPILFVLPSRGLWHPDYAPVRAVLQAGGHTVKTAASRPGLSTLAMNSPGTSVPIEVVLDDGVRGSDYAALLFCGADVAEYCKDGPAAQQVRRLIGEMERAGRPVGGLCKGSLVLAAAGKLQGKRAAYPPEADHLFPQHGAMRDRDNAVADGPWITGATPNDARRFAELVLAKLQGR